MTLLLKQLFAFLKLLNSDTGTNQIASGIAAGFVLGMTPAFSLQTILIFVCILFFRIQMGAAFLSAFFFSFVAYLLDPVFHSLGSLLLELESLKAIFTQLYNLPIVPFTRFNNSVVLGSGVLSLLMFPVVYILAKILVQKYRILVVAKFQQTKFWKFIKSTSLYKWYYQYESLYGN